MLTAYVIRHEQGYYSEVKPLDRATWHFSDARLSVRLCNPDGVAINWDTARNDREARASAAEMWANERAGLFTREA